MSVILPIAIPPTWTSLPFTSWLAVWRLERVRLAAAGAEHQHRDRDHRDDQRRDRRSPAIVIWLSVPYREFV